MYHQRSNIKFDVTGAHARQTKATFKTRGLTLAHAVFVVIESIIIIIIFS